MGEKAIVGVGGELRVIVTMTVCGVFVAPLAEIVSGALYVPADIPAELTLRTIDPAPLPLTTLGVSHGEFSETVQLRVPAPVLLIASD